MKIEDVKIEENLLLVKLSDGRVLSLPLEFYPRLLYSSDKERNNWIITGLGEGIHWPDIDEDISLTNLINRSPSGESKSSFEKWNSGRKR
jgi:hypothetical protein